MINRKRKNGISLAELAMTSALIGVLSYMGYTGLSDLVNAQAAKTGASQIAYAIRTAKQIARTKGVVTTLSFTAGSNNYDILVGGQSITNTNNFGTTSGKMPDDVTITASTCNDIGFNVDGTLSDSSGNIVYNSCSVTVGASGSPQQTVVINGKTGSIRYD